MAEQGLSGQPLSEHITISWIRGWEPRRLRWACEMGAAPAGGPDRGNQSRWKEPWNEGRRQRGRISIMLTLRQCVAAVVRLCELVWIGLRQSLMWFLTLQSILHPFHHTFAKFLRPDRVRWDVVLSFLRWEFSLVQKIIFSCGFHW